MKKVFKIILWALVGLVFIYNPQNEAFAEN